MVLKKVAHGLAKNLIFILLCDSFSIHSQLLSTENRKR